jgi:hypothetical protein
MQIEIYPFVHVGPYRQATQMILCVLVDPYLGVKQVERVHVDLFRPGEIQISIGACGGDDPYRKVRPIETDSCLNLYLLAQSLWVVI